MVLIWTNGIANFAYIRELIFCQIESKHFLYFSCRLHTHYETDRCGHFLDLVMLKMGLDYGKEINKWVRNFLSAKETLSGIENIRIIQKGQIQGQTASQFSFSNFANLMA